MNDPAMPTSALVTIRPVLAGHLAREPARAGEPVEQQAGGDADDEQDQEEGHRAEHVVISWLTGKVDTSC